MPPSRQSLRESAVFLTFTILLGLTVVVFASETSAQGTWTTKAPMPTARIYLATGVLNGELYAVGGQPVGGYTTDANEVYDPVTNIWTTYAPALSSRSNQSAVGIDGKLYVVGGCINGDCNNRTSRLEEFDPATNTWAIKASMPAAREDMAAGAIGGKLYVAGGRPAVATLFVYDPATDTWTTKAPMPTARQQAGGAVINGKLYVVGGGPDDSTATATLQVYDPVVDTWATKTPMPTARLGLGAGVVDGILYAVSGWNGADNLQTVDAYDPATDSWTTVAPIPTIRALPKPQGINGVLYVVGSEGGGLPSIGTLEAFTPPDATPPPPPSSKVNVRFHYSANSSAGGWSATKTVSPTGAVNIGPQAMEGNLTVRPGDTLRAGYDFTMPGSHSTAHLLFMHTTVTFQALCASGSGGGTIVVDIADQTYTDPQNSSGWYPSGDQKSASAFQGSVAVPDLCGGAAMSLKQGGTFTSTVGSM